MRAPIIAALVSLVLIQGVRSQEPGVGVEPTTSDEPRTSTAQEPGLLPERLYSGVGRPVMVEVTPARSFGSVALALLDGEGTPLTKPVTVNRGRVDLSDVMPEIWNLRRTAYVQMLDGETPVGSALVLQPLLSRMVPVTEVSPHPVTGKPHNRIVGWVDENQPAAAVPPTSQQPPNSATEPGSAPTAGTPPPQPSPAKPAGEGENPASPVERLFAGLRVYPERDVVLHTSKGDIRLAMRPDEAPNTVWNFLELARGGFYREVVFHRIVPRTRTGHPFVIQAGDPTATGDGGPGYWLPIEDSRLPHDFGVISMARSDDPDSNGSQFFICLSREGTSRLDGQYCAFGYAVDGAQAIIEIASVELADVETGRPVVAPLIRDAELVPAPPRVPGRGRPDQRVTEGGARPAQPVRVPR